MNLLRTLNSLLILLVCLASTAQVVSSDEIFLTLEKSIQMGLDRNNQMKAAREKIVQADQARKQARSDLLPKIAMSYAYRRLDEPEKLDILTHSGLIQWEISTTNNFQWVGSVTQPIFRGFGLVSSYQLAALGVDRARSDEAITRMDTALRIKQAYFSVLAAEKAIGVAEQAVASLSAHVTNARSYLELRMIPANDLLKAEVQLSNSQYDLVKATNAGRQSRAALNTLLVLPIDAAPALQDILLFQPQQTTYNIYVEKALRQRPEMESIQLALQQIHQQIRLARSRMYPEIGLQYRYIKEGDTYDVSGSPLHEPNRWEVAALLSWTVWEWGKTAYAVDEGKSRRSELQHLKAGLEDSIRLEVKEALLKLEQAEKNIPTAARAVEQGEENLRVSIERFNAQAAGSTEVLDAQTLLTQAQLNYTRALYDHNLARAELQRAIGAY